MCKMSPSQLLFGLFTQRPLFSVRENRGRCICDILSADPAPGQNSSQDSYQEYFGPPWTQQNGKKSWSL